MTWLIADTHGTDIKDKRIKKGDTLVHLGDFCWGELPKESINILVIGNHDNNLQASRFHFACDGIVLGTALLTHEPAERMPKGCHINICGHLHDNVWSDYGFERKAFHRLLEPGVLYDLESFR